MTVPSDDTPTAVDNIHLSGSPLSFGGCPGLVDLHQHFFLRLIGDRSPRRHVSPVKNPQVEKFALRLQQFTLT